MNYTIRPATVRDAEALLAIYAPYVTTTAITFECTVPTTAEFAQRIERKTALSFMSTSALHAWDL